MRNRDKWKPSKFVYRNGKLQASRDRREVSVGSRLTADIVARFYDENLKKYARGKLLDLGCGKVPLFLAYRDYITENICVDWGNSLHKNEFLDLECDLREDLPFSEGEFDTILLSDVLEHIPNPEHLWSEMARILAPGGKLLLNVPFFYWLHEQPYDYYRYTEFALRRFAENAGLKIVLLEPMGGVPEILADIISKSILRIPKLGTAVSIFTQWTTSALLKTPLGKSLSESTAKSFPLGYFLVAEKPL